MNEMLPIVSVAMDALTDDEVLALLLCVQLGTDPRGSDGYDKVAALWGKDGVTMNDLTRESFIRLASMRLR